MKKKKAGFSSSFELPSGERALWDADKPDHDCDCPGPPPHFYLPPPPRPSSLSDSGCLTNPAYLTEICESVPVMDAEYQYRPVISSFAIVLIVIVVVVIFLIFGTFLVVIKKKKMRNLISRKYSPQDLCDSGSANGVIYEDLTSIRTRVLSPHYHPGQTILPSIEMLDVSTHSDLSLFTPVFICPASSVLDSFNSQELFNPVYEELSTESEERGETDSEEMPRFGVSEDEFAEDELSLGRETDDRLKKGKEQNDCSLHGFINNDVSRDLVPSDVSNIGPFIENSERNLNSSHHKEKEKKTKGDSFFGEAKQRSKSPARKKIWKNKVPPPLPEPPTGCNEFHESFLLKNMLRVYPDVTDVDLRCSRSSPTAQPSGLQSLEKNSCESVSAIDNSNSHSLKPDIFSTFGDMQDSVKSQNQDSFLGSDSRLSNNTSGGKSSTVLGECTLINCKKTVLS